jgi:acyl carrier protein
MTTKTRSFRPSPALLIACLALFMTLGGTALAVGVAKNSIRSAQIVDGTVRTTDLRDNSVNAPKIAADAVGNEEIAENAVASPEVAPDSLTAQDLGAASVTSTEVADNSLTANDLGPDSVGASEIQADAVGSSELQADSVHASELAALLTSQSSTAIKGGDNASVTATCPAGTTVISGGGSAGFYQVHLTSTYRVGNGWRIDARSGAVVDTTITAYAYCLAG